MKGSSQEQVIRRKKLPVRGASQAQISFDAAPPGAELIVDHLRGNRLLGRECRSLNTSASHVDIKTHPGASHIACLLRVLGLPVNGVRFDVHCGENIEPTGRNFIVIGAMKAGTTTLFSLLQQHPALCSSSIQLPGISFKKEINYFRRLYRKGNTALHYDWRFPFDPSIHEWTLDVSPGYARWPGSKCVPMRIASLGGTTKLAYILRDPVDRIESHIAHTLQTGAEMKSLRHYIRTSCYAMQLDKFMPYFNRDNILLLDFEQLQHDPSATTATICDFLGVEHINFTSEIHNTRSIEYRLDARQRQEFADAVRPDVRRLISHYGFKPAEKWLQRSFT